MKNVMLDFETLGNGKNKAVCQVGAAYFDPLTGEVGSTYKANIDVDSHVKYGGKLDGRTVYWWLEQSDAARQSLLTNRRDIMQVFFELNEFLKPSTKIWSHATFDFVTLMDTLDQLGIKPSFSYKNARDIRTLVDLANITTKDIPREGTHHDALDDCLYQIKYCVKALSVVKSNKEALRILKNLSDRE